jgi:ferric-dicitrate binding protein FerR (iron transport regulator)
MAESRLEYLFNQYMKNVADENEKEELKELLERPENETAIQDLLGQFISETKPTMALNSEARDAILQAIFQVKPVAKVVSIKHRFRWTRYIAAASVILLLATGTYFILNRNTSEKPVAKEQTKTDILPGHDGAVLTLADGSKIVLDNAQDGKITDVAVKNGNKVSYQNSSQTKVEYNTMTTPKGRQFSLVLPDGTQVWLNAASSITYPTAFVGNDRKVSITGEAYFEVTHNVSKPFHVNVNGMDVQVLGTHFNINAYGDDGNTKTTLLQGSIKVSVAGKMQVVKPGQQTQVASNNIKLVPDADIDAVMAWRNGFFSFENTGIKEIMKQLSRWYDVEVIYQGEPKDIFTGEIDRNLTLSQVLKVLSDTKVKYRIEESRKLIILP